MDLLPLKEPNFRYIPSEDPSIDINQLKKTLLGSLPFLLTVTILPLLRKELNGYNLSLVPAVI